MFTKSPKKFPSGGQVSQALARYAGLLAGQGSLRTALSYLSQVEVGEGELAELKQRLEQSLAPRTAPQQPSNVQAARQQQPARGRQASLTPAPRKMSNDQPSFNYGQPQQPSFMQPQEPPLSNSYQQQYKPPSMEREAPPVPTFPSAFPTATSPSSASRSSNPLLGKLLRIFESIKTE